VVIVISGCRSGAYLELSPGGLVALLEVLGRTIWVSVVAQGEDCALDATDEPGGCLVVLPCAVGDVARRDDDIPGRRSRGRSGAQPRVRRTATKATMTTFAVLPASMFDASKRLPGFQEEHPCLFDLRH